MEIVFWILLCTLACVGGVELISRLFYGFRPLKEAAAGYLVIRLGKDSPATRKQMEYYLNWIEWNGPGYPVIFLRDEGDRGAEELFRHYFNGLPGVRLANWRELERILGTQ